MLYILLFKKAFYFKGFKRKTMSIYITSRRASVQCALLIT